MVGEIEREGRRQNCVWEEENVGVTEAEDAVDLLEGLSRGLAIGFGGFAAFERARTVASKISLGLVWEERADDEDEEWEKEEGETEEGSEEEIENEEVRDEESWVSLEMSEFTRDCLARKPAL